VKILMLHNRYQVTSGEEIVVQAEKSLLETKGHNVALMEVDNANISSAFEKAKAAINVIYSVSSKRQVTDKIKSFCPDIVHIHNFFPILSPSVYYACHEAQVPVIQTLHNYRLLCSIASFFRDGKVCEDCLSKPFPWPGIVHGCYRGSKVGTATVAAMQSVHSMMGTWQDKVSSYIALTDFARSKFIQGGLPADKIAVKPNFLTPDPGIGEGKGNYVLFVGRLWPEKGIDTLLTAWQQIGNRLPLKIVGDGPLAPQVAEAMQQIPGIEWLKQQPRAKVLSLMKNATVLVMPSIWYEGFPMSIAEAYAIGLPVITSNIGSMSALIDHGRTGLHFRPGDAEDLVTQIEWVLTHFAEMVQMRQSVRAEFETKYTAEKNYQILMNIYQQAASSSTLPILSSTWLNNTYEL
jgi:glycosyltransferase involved in cell wall biosynthesis